MISVVYIPFCLHIFSYKILCQGVMAVEVWRERSLEIVVLRERAGTDPRPGELEEAAEQ